MKEFAHLFNAVDQSTKTTVKTNALAEYFTAAPEQDRLWTIALFSGKRPKRAVTKQAAGMGRRNGGHSALAV